MKSRFPQGLRRGAAMTEMALLLPLLCFLLVAGIDFARVYFALVTITHCASNGATYASLSTYDPSSPYQSIQQAALADAGNLSPTPTVSNTSGVDSAGNRYVEVTVTYPFQTLVNWPGIASETTLSRTVRMQQSPATPGS